MSHRYTLMALAVASLFAQSAVANEAETGAVIVTATRTATRASETLSDITVVTREEIESLGQKTAVELLQTIPSVQVISAGGRGGTSSVYIRGANANHTLVLIDGQRVSSATVGTTALEHVPADQIDHIEILRGPASSLYGADAIGGVIQIFTRKGSGAASPYLSLGYGSYATSIGAVGYGGQSENTRFNVQFGWDRSTGYSAIRSPAVSKTTNQPTFSAFDSYNPDKDGYRNTNLTAQVSRRLEGGTEIGANLLYTKGRKQFDNNNCDAFYTVCTANFDNVQTQTLQSYSGFASFKPTTDWKSQIRVGQSSDETQNPLFDPLANTVSNQVFKTTQDQLSWQNDIKAFLGTVMVAVEFRNEKVGSTQTFDAASRATRSLLAGYQGRFGLHSVQLSGRVDDISRMGSHQTGSLAYGYEFAPGWRARASAGTAFHAPTFADLYWPADPVNFYKGNPNLKPESAYNQEVGVNFDGAHTQASLTVFRNRVKDLLDFVNGTAPDFLGYMGNLGSAVLKGVNVSASHAFGGWTVRGNFDYLSARDDLTGLSLQRRAPRSASLEVRRQFGELDAGLQVQGISSRYNDKAHTMQLAGYGLLNLDVSYRLNKEWSVLARANNVLDRRYEVLRFDNYDGTYNSIGTPGANVFVGVRYAPK